MTEAEILMLKKRLQDYRNAARISGATIKRLQTEIKERDLTIKQLRMGKQSNE